MTEEYIRGTHPSHTSCIHQDQGDHELQMEHYGERPADAVAAAERPSFAKSLLNDLDLRGRGNAPIRQAAMQSMQCTHGNWAVQRLVQRSGQGVPVQREPAPIPLTPDKEEKKRKKKTATEVTSAMKLGKGASIAGLVGTGMKLMGSLIGEKPEDICVADTGDHVSNAATVASPHMALAEGITGGTQSVYNTAAGVVDMARTGNTRHLEGTRAGNVRGDSGTILDDG